MTANRSFQHATAARRGVTLIELICCMLGVFVIFVGGALANELYEAESWWGRIGVVVFGGFLGWLALALTVALIVLPISLVGAIRRVLQPAELVCRCHEPARGTPEHLLPDSPLAKRALEESSRLLAWPELARLRSAPRSTTDTLRLRLANGSLSDERVALAAQLGDAAAAALNIEPREPLLRYRSHAVPEEVHRALCAGLPPRLCVVWALSCAERLLPVFEAEFHQDTRPRQALGAALLILRDENVEAIDVARPISFALWSASDAGCRCVHRSLSDRFWARSSRGEKAAPVLFQLGRAVSNFAEPSHLWAVYASGDVAGAYATPRNRCEMSQPAYNAEWVVSGCLALAADPESERQWQRDELARLILNWERWDEDREAWRARVEREWIPRVKETLTGVWFDVPAFAEQIRETLVPWPQKASA